MKEEFRVLLTVQPISHGDGASRGVGVMLSVDKTGTEERMWL